MIKEAKLSDKCQITIPKQIRDVLGINKGDNVVFFIDNDEVKLTSIKNVDLKLKNTNKSATIKNGGNK